MPASVDLAGGDGAFINARRNIFEIFIQRELSLPRGSSDYAKIRKDFEM